MDAEAYCEICKKDVPVKKVYFGENVTVLHLECGHSQPLKRQAML
jgi:hypothetical protein